VNFSPRFFDYNQEQAGLGARFTAEVEDGTARALAFPLAGSVVTKNARRVFLKEFPFALVYRPVADGIMVIALAHHARYSGYWESRVQDRARAFDLAP
jgi:hypothetical protein